MSIRPVGGEIIAQDPLKPCPISSSPSDVLAKIAVLIDGRDQWAFNLSCKKLNAHSRDEQVINQRIENRCHKSTDFRRALEDLALVIKIPDTLQPIFETNVRKFYQSFRSCVPVLLKTVDIKNDRAVQLLKNACRGAPEKCVDDAIALLGKEALHALWSKMFRRTGLCILNLSSLVDVGKELKKLYPDQMPKEIEVPFFEAAVDYFAKEMNINDEIQFSFNAMSFIAEIKHKVREWQTDKDTINLFANILLFNALVKTRKDFAPTSQNSNPDLFGILHNMLMTSYSTVEMNFVSQFELLKEVGLVMDTLKEKKLVSMFHTALNLLQRLAVQTDQEDFRVNFLSLLFTRYKIEIGMCKVIFKEKFAQTPEDLRIQCIKEFWNERVQTLKNEISCLRDEEISLLHTNETLLNQAHADFWQFKLRRCQSELKQAQNQKKNLERMTTKDVIEYAASKSEEIDKRVEEAPKRYKEILTLLEEANTLR